jgi:AcrR family transcriptional regulator
VSAADSVATPTPRRVPAAERHEQFLNAAAAIILDQGVDAVSMEAVAAHAGVNKVIVYRQFANRGELLVALFDREIAIFNRRIGDAIAAPGTFEERTLRTLDVWFDVIASSGPLLGAIGDARVFDDKVLQRYNASQKQGTAFMGAFFAEEYAVSKDDAVDVAAMFIAALDGLLERWIASPGRRTRRRLAATYTTALLATLDALAAKNATGDGAMDGDGRGAGLPVG